MILKLITINLMITVLLIPPIQTYSNAHTLNFSSANSVNDFSLEIHITEATMSDHKDNNEDHEQDVRMEIHE